MWHCFGTSVFASLNIFLPFRMKRFEDDPRCQCIFNLVWMGSNYLSGSYFQSSKLISHINFENWNSNPYKVNTFIFFSLHIIFVLCNSLSPFFYYCCKFNTNKLWYECSQSNGLYSVDAAESLTQMKMGVRRMVPAGR